MTEKLSRQFVAKKRDYTVSVRMDAFKPSAGAEPGTRGKHDRKYNIRVKQEDIALLDALSARHNIPRSMLLNHLLHEILLDGLHSIEERDTRLLIAQTADERASYDDLARGWVYDAIETESQRIIENIVRFNRAELDVQDEPHAPHDHVWNSESYVAVKQALKGIET